MSTSKQTGSIQFLMGDSTEVLRISKDGITANPDVPVDKIASRVLELLEQNIRVLVQRAVEAEREACAKVVEDFDFDYTDYAAIGLATAVNAIRTRKDK